MDTKVTQTELKLTELDKKVIELDKKVDIMATKLDPVTKQIEGLTGQISLLLEELRKNYATREWVDSQITNTARSIRSEYTPVKRIVYGAVGIILTAALVALISLIITK